MLKEWRCRRGLCAQAFLLLSSLVVATTAWSFPFSGKVANCDSSVFMYVAKVILRGGMPYVDTFDHKGPLLYIIDVFGLLINERWGIWLLEWITILIVFVFAYKIARLLECGRLASSAVVALTMVVLYGYFEGGNFTEEYACAFLMISLYLFLQFFRKGYTTWWRLMCCGASFAAVCMLRINMVALWGVMCIGVLIYNLKTHRGSKTWAFIGWFLLGVAVLLIPIVIWLWAKGALIPFVEDYFGFNAMYSGDEMRASLANVAKAVKHFCVGRSLIITWPIFLYFCIRERSMVNWLCLIALVLSVLAVCISGQKYAHYGITFCPLVVYALARFSATMEHGFFAKSKIKALHKIGMVVALVGLTGALFVRPIYHMTRDILSIPLSATVVAEEQKIADVIKEHTDEEDLISVCGNRNAIYLLSDRMSASRYSYQFPIADIDPSIKEEYLNDLRQGKAKMIIVGQDDILRKEVLEIVQNDYVLVDTIGNTELYLKEIT